MSEAAENNGKDLDVPANVGSWWVWGGKKNFVFVFYSRLFDQQILFLNGVVNAQYKKINQYDKLVYGTDKEKKQRNWLEKNDS